MGIILGISFIGFVMVGLIVCAVTYLSAFRNREFRQYWVASILFFGVGPLLPIFFSAPLEPVVSNFHREAIYFIATIFSLTTAVVLVGSLLLIIPSFLKKRVARIMSAASWGLLSAFFANVIRLIILIKFF